MPFAQQPVAGHERTIRQNLDRLDGGWSTRAHPTMLDPRKLAAFDNCCYATDGVISKRPGNGYYGGVTTGRIDGSGKPVLALARFYTFGPPQGQLIAQCNGKLWAGNDMTGAFTQIGTTSTTYPCRFAPLYDPDDPSGAAVGMFITDGLNTPRIWDGTHLTAVQTGGVFLPYAAIGNVAITPRYCATWNYHLVYAGEPTEVAGLYIADAMRPERFTGDSYIDSALSSYTAYFPAGRNSYMGPITGLAVINEVLIIFFLGGVIGCQNTGTYGTYEFTFYHISSSVGMPSPYSFAVFDNVVMFYGGDRFYATDGQGIGPLPDELPTVYSRTNRSGSPPEIQNNTTVIGARRGYQYWASYDGTGSGHQDTLVVFDTSANGGWTFQPGYSQAAGYAQGVAGGAWAHWPSGMHLASALECKGASDETSRPMFWGGSDGDYVAQHDIGTFDDFGAPIAVNVQSSAYFWDKPASPKTVQGLYLVMLFDLRGSAYTQILQAYIVEDLVQVAAPTIGATVPTAAVLYGASDYGTFNYAAAGGRAQYTVKTYPQPLGINDAPAYSISCGVSESSTYPFNLIGFILEVTIDDPAP